MCKGLWKDERAWCGLMRRPIRSYVMRFLTRQTGDKGTWEIEHHRCFTRIMEKEAVQVAQLDSNGIAPRVDHIQSTGRVNRESTRPLNACKSYRSEELRQIIQHYSLWTDSYTAGSLRSTRYVFRFRGGEICVLSLFLGRRIFLEVHYSGLREDEYSKQ